MTHVSGEIVTKLINVLICLYLGIVRNGDTCEWRDSYQAYKCPDMVIFRYREER